MYENIERLIERDKPYLLNQAMYITGKTEDAEDLLQETLMKACLGFNSFKQDSNFRAWSKKIMINAHMNQVRRGPSNILPLADSYLKREQIIMNNISNVSYINDPEETFFHNYISEEILEPFILLPDKYKIVFSLFHFSGYPYDVISRVVNVPLGTVKSRIYRAKQYLTEQISNSGSVGRALQSEVANDKKH